MPFVLSLNLLFVFFFFLFVLFFLFYYLLLRDFMMLLFFLNDFYNFLRMLLDQSLCFFPLLMSNEFIDILNFFLIFLDF